MIRIPEGWTVRGALPAFPPDSANDDQLDAFDEDLLQLVEPSGEYAIDIGWYPPHAREGTFRGRVVNVSDWSEPLEIFETTDLDTVAEWANGWIARVSELAGVPDQISHELVNLVLVEVEILKSPPFEVTWGRQPQPTPTSDVSSSAWGSRPLAHAA